MVLFFQSSEGYTLYMGADKYENEFLIKYGLDEDLWFHVDNLSSAHVYLRLRPGQTIDDLSSNAIEECAQLVKANSIEGCKLREVYVVYTPWANLHKTSDMAVGAIGYHRQSEVRRLKVVKNNQIVGAINRTKEVRTLREHEFAEAQEAARERRRNAEKTQRKNNRLAAEQSEKEARKQREEQQRLQSYADIFEGGSGIANTEIVGSVDDSAARDFEDDFM